MSVIKEFKEFAVKGNAVDMAIGIVIGAAFGKIVSSLVNDVIMPPVGMLMGGAVWPILTNIIYAYCLVISSLVFRCKSSRLF